MQVHLQRCDSYDPGTLQRALLPLAPLFRSVIRRGDVVVLKPNWLAASHKYDPDEWECVITHPAVITAALERVLDALDGAGRVVIADGPQTDSSWSGIMARMTPDVWRAMGEASGVRVEVMDLREHEWTARDGVVVDRRPLPGDPRGSTCCDLGAHSAFSDHRASGLGYYGADYDKAETNLAHSGGRHRYRVSRTIIEADVFVNLPKMKTHKKAGITCSLKNLVGINTYKNWLPHHNEGTPAQGGDQFPDASPKRRTEAALLGRIKSVVAARPRLGRVFVPLRAVGKRVFGDTRQVVRSGNWHGNDTLWRMVLDLNRVLLYAQPDGALRADEPAQRKRYLTLVDGVIAGEGDGPEAPSRRLAGVLIAGCDAVAVDAACAKVMGLDWRRIPCLHRAFELPTYRVCGGGYADIEVVDYGDDPHALPAIHPLADDALDLGMRFRPHFGWIGAVELPAPPAVR